MRTLIICIVILKVSLSDCYTQSRLTGGLFLTNSFLHVPTDIFSSSPSLTTNKFGIAYGIKLEFEINENWIFLVSPNYFKLEYYNGCLDSTHIMFSNAFNPKPSYIEYFFTSENKCIFTSSSSYDYFQLPILFKYGLNGSKNKANGYFYFGNTMKYNFSYKDSTINNLNHQVLKKEDGKIGFISFFMPTIGGGIDYKINKSIIAFTDLSISVYQNQNYLFKNYTLGLTFGVKSKL